jgi:hypothetical protein
MRLLTDSSMTMSEHMALLNFYAIILLTSKDINMELLYLKVSEPVDIQIRKL